MNVSARKARIGAQRGHGLALQNNDLRLVVGGRDRSRRTRSAQPNDDDVGGKIKRRSGAFCGLRGACGKCRACGKRLQESAARTGHGNLLLG